MVDKVVVQLNNLFEAIEKAQSANPEKLFKLSETLKTKFYSRLSTVPAALQILTQTQSQHVMLLAALSLKKVILKSWTDEEDEGLKRAVKSSLLSILGEFDNEKIQRYVSEGVSSIAICEESLWPELAQRLDVLLRSSNAAQREIAIYTINECLWDPTLPPAKDATPTALTLSQVLDAIVLALQDTNSMNVRSIAVAAVGKLSRQLEVAEPAYKATFKAILPVVLSETQAVVARNEPDQAEGVVDTISSLLCYAPTLFDDHFAAGMEYLVQVATDTTLKRAIRNNAFYALIKNPEICKHKILEYRLVQPVLEKVLPVCAEESDEAEDEDQGDLDDDEEFDLDNLKVSKSALDLIHEYSLELPPKHVFIPLMEKIHPIMSEPSSDDPETVRWRKACLSVIYQLVEGCVEKVRSYFDQVFGMVVTGLHDRQRPVRKAACTALKYMSHYLEYEVAQKYDTVIPLLLRLLGERNFEVLEALESVFSATGKAESSNYIDAAVELLIPLLRSDVKYLIKTDALRVLAAAIASAESTYQKYAADTMALMEGFIRVDEDASGEEMVLSNAALDCVTALCCALQEEGFKPFAPRSLEIAVKTMENHPEEEDARKCAISLFTYLASHYANDVEPFVGVVVEELLKTAEQEPSESDEEYLDLDASDSEILADQILRSKDAQQKLFAADILADLFDVLQEKFSPYVERSFEVIRQLTANEEEDLRATAFVALFRFIRTAQATAQKAVRGCAEEPTGVMGVLNARTWETGLPVKQPVDRTVAGMIDVVMKQVTEALACEEMEVVIKDIFDELGNTCSKVGPAVIANEEYRDAVYHSIAETLQNKARWQVADQDWVEDLRDEQPYHLTGKVDDLKELTETESKLMGTTVSLVSSIAEVLGESTAPLADQVMGHMLKYYHITEEAQDKSVVIGTLGEVLNALGKLGVKFVQPCYQPVIESLISGQDDLATNAAYTIGVMCSIADLSSEYNSILTHLRPLFDKDQVGNTVDNCCGAVSRMILACPSMVPIPDVMKVVLSKLPLTQDPLENKPVYECLCSLLEAGHEFTIKSLPRIVDIFRLVLQNRGDILNETRHRIISTLQLLTSESHPETANIIHEQVPQETQQAILAEIRGCNVGPSVE